MRRRALALPLSAVLFFTLGCIAIIPGYDPNDPMKVTVTTVQSSIMPGGTLQLTVTVTGDGPLTVQWDVDGIQGGSSTVGTISATGLYTAPAAVTADLPVSITATSLANTSVSATVSILVEAPTITSVAVVCNPTTILTTGSSSCTPTVLGTGKYNPAIIWSAMGGSITSAGVFTPSTAGTATITATSVQDATRYGSTTVSVGVPPAITSVSVTCLSSPILVSQTSSCTANVSGVGAYNPSVAWSATNGSITPAGVFTASAIGNATITATSVQDSTKSGSTSVPVAVTPAISSVSVTCQPSPILVSQTSKCTASVTGAGAYNPSVNWSATGGSITSAGVFTASTVGSATITATSVQDATKSGSTPVTVAVPPAITSVSVTCLPSPIMVSQTSSCLVNVTGVGAYDPSVTWSADSGTIDQSGNYIAPSNPLTATIKATSNQDGTKFGTTTVTVNPAPTITGIIMNCSLLVVPVGQTSQCTESVQGTGNYSQNVVWEVNGVEGGTPSIGTISASGLYQAPATAPSPYVVAITATSAEDATKSAWLSITIEGPIASGTQTIGPGGGTITLADGSAVTIPANVLQADTAVTLSSSTTVIKPTNTLFQGIGPSLSLSFNPPPGPSGLSGQRISPLGQASPQGSSAPAPLTFIVNGDPASSAAQIQGAFGIANVNNGVTTFYSLPSTYNSATNQTTLTLDPSLVTANSTVQVGLTGYLECALDSAKLQKWDTTQNKFVDAASGTCQAGPKTLVMISGMNSCPNGTFNVGDNLAAKVYASAQPNYSGSIYAIEYPWTLPIDHTAKSVGATLDSLVGPTCALSQSFDIVAYSEGVVVGLNSLGDGNVDNATRAKLDHFISVAGPIEGTPIADDVDNIITEIVNETISEGDEVEADLLGLVDKGDFSLFIGGLTKTSSTITNIKSDAALATNTNFDAFGGDLSCTFLWGLVSETDFVFGGAPNDCVVAVSSSLPQDLSFISPLNEYEFQENHVNLVNNSKVVPVILAALNDTAPNQNYTLATSPSAVSVTAGSGGSFQLTATSIDGFSGTVTISPFDSNGISGSCSPSSISVSSSAAGTSTCTFSTGSGMSAGVYTLSVDTSGSYFSPSTSVQVTVTTTGGTPSYSASMSDSGQSITAGGSAFFYLTASSVNGFTGSVSLQQASMSISGATSSWSPSTISITPSSPGVSTLTVYTSTSTPAGTYWITEYMPNGLSPQVSLTVTSGSGGGGKAPKAVTGSASASTNSATLYGTVNPNGSDTHYYFEYGTSNTLSSYTSTGTQDLGSGTSAQGINANTGSLSAGTQYYFRVVAYNSYGTTPGSILSFSTTSAQTPPIAHFTMTGQGQTFSDGGTLPLSITTGGSVPASFTSTSSGSVPIASYVWKVNGTQYCGSVSPCNLTFTGAGNYTVALTVTDQNNNTSAPATGTVVVTVSNPRPTVTGVNPSTISSAQYVTLSGTGFTPNSWHLFSADGGKTYYWPDTNPTYVNQNTLSIYVNHNLAPQTLWIFVCPQNYSGNTIANLPNCSAGHATLNIK